MTFARMIRSLLCLALNGEHEFYLVRTRTRIFRRCLICCHETRGWDVNPDRPPIVNGTRRNVRIH